MKTDLGHYSWPWLGGQPCSTGDDLVTVTPAAFQPVPDEKAILTFGFSYLIDRFLHFLMQNVEAVLPVYVCTHLHEAVGLSGD